MMLRATDKEIRAGDLVDISILHSTLFQLRGQLLRPHERAYLREELIRSLLELQDSASHEN